MPRRSHVTPSFKGALVLTACVPSPAFMRSSLQPHLTGSQSTALYRRFLVDITETTRDVEGVDFYLAYSRRGGRESLEPIVPSAFRFLYQEARSTGERLARMTGRLLDAGYERVLYLCSNYPDLPSCLLHQGVAALERERTDMVIGPSERGGFYLFGLKERHTSLFSTADWDSQELERQVEDWAADRNVRLHRLPSWYDIRTVADLRRHLGYYAIRCSRPEGHSSQTGRYLQKIQDRIEAARC